MISIKNLQTSVVSRQNIAYKVLVDSNWVVKNLTHLKFRLDCMKKDNYMNKIGISL